jgi:uncharacterized protein YrrD
MSVSLRPGSKIVTADGDELGTIRHLVVDPSRSEVTHLLVEKGVFFTDDRVVPIDAIDHLDDDVAVLMRDIDPTGLPGFERGDYTPGDEATGARLDLAPAEFHLWRHPIAHAAPFPLYPAYPMAPSTASPEGAADTSARKALVKGEIVGGRTPVVSVEGEKVGTVDEVVVDRVGRLSHLVVDLGLLSGDVILPAHWIAGIDAESVRLAVSDAALESLETIT